MAGMSIDLHSLESNQAPELTFRMVGKRPRTSAVGKTLLLGKNSHTDVLTFVKPWCFRRLLELNLQKRDDVFGKLLVVRTTA